MARQRAPPTPARPSTFDARRRARAWRFPTESFDAVVSLRVLMHTPDWRAVRSPSSAAWRASASSSTIPALASAAALQAVARTRRARRRARASRPYRVFAIASVDDALARARLPRRRSPPPVRPADRAAQDARIASPSPRGSRARSPRLGLLAPLRLTGDPRGGAVRVLVTGATGFTGGHLARALVGRGRRRCARSCATARGRATLGESGVDARRRATWRDAAALDRATAGRRRRLQHRRALSQAGLPAETYRAVNADGVRTLIEAAAADRRAPRRALQHGRRARRRRAPAGQRGRAAQARRHLSGDEARRRSACARGGGARPASRWSIARPTGIYGPGDRRLLKLFRGVARRRFVDARRRARSSTI